MEASTIKPVMSMADQDVKVTYEKRNFFNIITWYRKVKTEMIKEDLIIVISDHEKYDKILVNGQEIKLKNG